MMKSYSRKYFSCNVNIILMVESRFIYENNVFYFNRMLFVMGVSDVNIPSVLHTTKHNTDM